MSPEPAATPEPTATEQRNLKAVADVLQYWNTGDIDGVLEFYDEEIAWKNIPLQATYHGHTEVRGFMNKLLTAMPDLNFSVSYKIAMGDNVSEQWMMRGTHLGEFLGIPATGRQIEIPGMSMIEMRNGRFLSDQFYFDTGNVLRQMRLLPPLAATETPAGRAVMWLAVNPLKAAAGLAALLVPWFALSRAKK
jgi:steroid delta-isomerase-like uncharacterized protein